MATCLVLGPAAGGSAARPAVPARSCDAITGVTRLMNAEWRIVALPGEHLAQPDLIACRRSAHGATRVLRIERAGTEGYVPFQLSGRRLLIQEDFGASAGGGGGPVLVVDLPTGRSLDLGFEGWNANPAFTRRPTALTANGGVVTATWSGTDASDGPFEGPMHQWDGRAFSGGLMAATSFTVPETRESNAVYVRSGETVTSVVPTPVPLGAFTGPRFATERNTLAARRPTAGVTRTLLGSRTVRAEGVDEASRWELVVDRRRGKAGTRIVLTNPMRPAAGFSVKLAAGGRRDLKVLGMRGPQIVVAGRFADGEGREIRVLPLGGPNHPVPATPAAERPGSVAFNSDGTWIADGTTLRRWAFTERTWALAGGQDLAFDGQAGISPSRAPGPPQLLHTDPDGRAASLPVPSEPSR